MSEDKDQDNGRDPSQKDKTSRDAGDVSNVAYTPYPDEPSYDMDEEDEDEYSRGPFLFLVALIVLLAFGGVIYVAYQQGLREGMRTPPPTLAAKPGPIRIKPANPGGVEEPYQDQFILNGETTVDSTILAPAPEEPMERPSEEPVDVASAEPALEEAVVAEASEPTIADLIEEDETADAGDDLAVMDLAEDVEDLAEDVEDAVEDTVALVTPEAVEEPAPIEIEPSATEEETSEVETILAPEPEPEEASPAEETEVAAVIPEPKPEITSEPEQPVVPEPTGSINAASGNYVIQVASIKNDMQSARERVDVIGTKHRTTLADLGFDIEKADLGVKGIYYRVRIGPFEQRAGAVSICEKLKGEGQDCFVTKP